MFVFLFVFYPVHETSQTKAVHTILLPTLPAWVLIDSFVYQGSVKNGVIKPQENIEHVTVKYAWSIVLWNKDYSRVLEDKVTHVLVNVKVHLLVNLSLNLTSN